MKCPALLLTLFLPALLWAQTPLSSAKSLPNAEAWGCFIEGQRLRLRHATSPNPVSEAGRECRVDSSHRYDALAYEADLRLDFGPPAYWQASVRMEFVAVEELDTLDLHLRGYTVNAASVEGRPCAFLRQDDRLLIALGAHPLQPGDSAHLEVQYSGAPVWQNGLGLSVSGSIAYTLSDPWGTRNWLACFDEPFDKARWALNLRCDSSYSVLSNGDLTGIQHHGDGTSTWSHRHDTPMSSYLVSLVCGRLTLLEDAWQGIPLRWFVYPQHVAPAWQAVSRVDAMFDCFTSLWGPYPFQSYAMGEAPIYGGMGGMEHQTCTTIGSGIVAGGLAYESIVAHELSHMWWGDSVTPVDFQHVWLNEGWATYAEAYFYQHLAGGDQSAFLNYLAQLQQTYLAWDSQYEPIYDPPDNDLFTVNQYEKAACVLHMLRQVMGEGAFHDAQRQWQAEWRFGTVTTAEYQAAMEAACGQDLDWFFQQWIYTGGYPTYGTVTEFRDEGDFCHVHLTVNQSHPRLSSFRAPVPLRIQSSLASLDTLVWIEEGSSSFSWTLPGSFDTLVFNHQHAVLCRHEELPANGGAPRWQVLGWQLSDSLGGNGDGDVAQGESAQLGLRVQNLGGWDTDVHFSVTSNTLVVSGAWPMVVDAGGGTVLDLPVGPVTLSEVGGTGMAWTGLNLLSQSAHFPEQSQSFRLPVGDPWLTLVAPADQQDVPPWISRELDSLAVFTDVELIDGQQVPLDIVPQHRALAWLGGDAGQRMNNAQATWVRGQLEASPCAILLSGQDLLDSLTLGTLPGNLLVLNADVSDRLVDGEAGSPLAGLSALLLGAGGAGNQVDPSSLAWQGGSTPPQVLARYRNSQEIALAQVELSNGSRLLLSGFGVEAISGMASTNSRRQWLEALLPQLDLLSAVDLPPRVEDGNFSLPGDFELQALHPNPFNSQARVEFRLAKAGHARLRLFDLRGALRATLLDEDLVAGQHHATVEGHSLPTGLYLLDLEVESRHAACKVLLVK